MNVVNLLPLEKDETVSAMVKIPAGKQKISLHGYQKGYYQENGYQRISAYPPERYYCAINLDEGDELCLC